jgi:hypothetical protein
MTSLHSFPVLWTEAIIFLCISYRQAYMRSCWFQSHSFNLSSWILELPALCKALWYWISFFVFLTCTWLMLISKNWELKFADKSKRRVCPFRYGSTRSWLFFRLHLLCEKSNFIGPRNSTCFSGESAPLLQQKRGFFEKNKCLVPLKNIPWNITFQIEKAQQILREMYFTLDIKDKEFADKFLLTDLLFLKEDTGLPLNLISKSKF